MENAGLPEQSSPKSGTEAQGNKQAGDAARPEKAATSQPGSPVNSAMNSTLNKGKSPTLPTFDIPEAVRETPKNAAGLPNQKIILIGGIVAVSAIALITGAWFAWQTKQSSNQPSDSTAQAQPDPGAATNPSPSASANTLLGHFAYNEAPQSQLQAIVPDGSIKLRKAAAQEFLAMVNAARADGVSLFAISGFRSKTDQDYLFFGVKAERGQVASQRAQVSAPPGYSEHHTGYAVDIGDGDVPATNLNPNFDKTRAYQWLQANAAHFSFELSFPKNNRQGVSYEPWHWRYVGDRDSLETFYKARSAK